jgi:transcriptional antiterminator NusG
VRQPLFPGYIFCRYRPACRGDILTTPGVVRILGWGGEPEPVAEHEVEAIRTIVASGLAYRASDYLCTGDRVRLHSGPLKGLEGLVLSVKEGSYRFVVSVALLNRSVSVEVDGSWLTLLGREAAVSTPIETGKSCLVDTPKVLN